MGVRDLPEGRLLKKKKKAKCINTVVKTVLKPGILLWNGLMRMILKPVVKACCCGILGRIRIHVCGLGYAV